MDFLSFRFYVFIVLLLLLYYAVPLKIRWQLLLTGSIAFYLYVSPKGWWVFLGTACVSYIAGRFLYSWKYSFQNLQLAKGVFIVSVVIVILPLIVTKHGNFLLNSVFHRNSRNWIVPLGLSFYTMQVIAYLADIYRGEILPQNNFFRYLLFLSFFPQLLQGPIPRYKQLGPQLYRGNAFDEHSFEKGFLLILWGFFLKLMIADKAAVVVNYIFDDHVQYAGGFILIAGILYSLQLYTDFLACVSIAQGSALLFGIRLADNFCRPYGSLSVKEFWRRWHISLSSWLRDYVYIPLGGSRKGTLMKYRNLILTFAVSGLWHGPGYKYLFWGFLHAFYQIAGELTVSARRRIYAFFNLPEDSVFRKGIHIGTTCFLIMTAWVIFRADSLRGGISMVISMVSVYNPWIFFNDDLFKLGLGWKEWIVLIFSVLLLIRAHRIQEKTSISEWILKQHILFRWLVYIGSILVIMVYGTYGFGFQAQDFIYGGF